MVGEEVISRAQELAVQGRPAEAADLLLQVLRRDGSLGPHLGVLADYMVQSDQPITRLIELVPPDQITQLLSEVVALPTDRADAVLEASTASLPPHVVLAAAVALAPRLSPERLCVWSARLREAGFDQMCPLIARANDVNLPASVRLHAAATAHRVFGDARALDGFVAAARRVPFGAPAQLLRAEIAELAPDLLGTFDDVLARPPEERPEPIVPLEPREVDPDHGPKVSVLIALYNYEEFIEECLRSVLDQTYRNIEVLVVDDCSTDGSVEKVREVAGSDPRVLLLCNEKNLGAVANLRRCVEQSSGDLLQCLCADNRFANPTTVARLVAAMESDPGVNMAASGFGHIDEQGTPLPDNANSTRVVEYPCVMDGHVLADMMLKPLLNYMGESVMFRRSALVGGEELFRLGGYEIRGLIDYSWWLRLCAAGKVAYIPDPLIQHRNHTKQIGSAYFLQVSHFVDLYSIVEGSREIGLLSDPLAERTALSTLLYRASGIFQSMTFTTAEEIDEFNTVMRAVVDRMCQLTRDALPATPGGAEHEPL
jgi:GT2 family glycosyltransferase